MQSSEGSRKDQVDFLSYVRRKSLSELPEEERERQFEHWTELDNFKKGLESQLSEKEAEIFAHILEEDEEELSQMFAEENRIAFLKFVQEKSRTIVQRIRGG